MIDTTQEPPVPIDELRDRYPEHIPGRNGPVHQITLSLWHRRGVLGIKLETVMVGGRRCTSLAALDRFYQQITQARAAGSWRPAQGIVATQRTAKQRNKAVRDSLKELGLPTT